MCPCHSNKPDSFCCYMEFYSCYMEFYSSPPSSCPTHQISISSSNNVTISISSSNNVRQMLCSLQQLTQRQALEQLFTNFTWWRIGDVDRTRYPDDSIQRMVLDQWGNTSIFFSLALFILFKVLCTKPVCMCKAGFILIISTNYWLSL